MKAQNHSPIKANFTSLEQNMKRYNPIPASKVMNKVGFFFSPYSMNVGLNKHMEFEEGPNASVKAQIIEALNVPGRKPEDRAALEASLGEINLQEHQDKA